MKRNVFLRAAACLLVVVVASMSLLGGTGAKYVASATVTASARVAKWDVSFDGAPYTCRLATGQNFAFFKAGKPYYYLKYKLVNNSEVAAKYVVIGKVKHVEACMVGGHAVDNWYADCDFMPALDVFMATTHGADPIIDQTPGDLGALCVNNTVALGLGAVQSIYVRVARATFTGLVLDCDVAQID